MVVTESKALICLQQFTDSNAKFMRWALLLQEFDFDIQHCPGKLNDLPDALSRYPTAEVTVNDDQDYSRMLPPVVSELYVIGDDPLLEYILETQEGDPLTWQMLGHLLASRSGGS